MGKITLLTPEQEAIFNLFRHDQRLTSQFYFTGGTALSAVYLHHRDSEDLDFFSDQAHDPALLTRIVTQWAAATKSKVELREREVVTFFVFTFPNNKQLKVDFGHYPYPALKKREMIDGVAVDSLLDIACNKLLTVNQRIEVKDYVDLYFLLQDFTIWDLMEGVHIKFRMEIELSLLATDFMLVDTFQTLPKMHKKLTLQKLQTFFRAKARQLAKRFTE